MVFQSVIVAYIIQWKEIIKFEKVLIGLVILSNKIFMYLCPKHTIEKN